MATPPKRFLENVSSRLLILLIILEAAIQQARLVERQARNCRRSAFGRRVLPCGWRVRLESHLASTAAEWFASPDGKTDATEAISDHGRDSDGGVNGTNFLKFYEGIHP